MSKDSEGRLDIYIDEIVPCLIKSSTGEKVDTVVFKIESRNYLKSFNKETGWHINWYTVPKDIEVYALATAKDNEIQGLIGLRDDKERDAIYMYWACTAPWNNEREFGSKKYIGVGGHLFAIAASKSIEYSHDGFAYGYALNQELVEHYEKHLGAKYIGTLHMFHIGIYPSAAKKLMEVYTYEEKDSKISGKS